ncbi:MAG: hypothetical protein AAF371_19330 [Pseudomonadota bacterium]
MEGFAVFEDVALRVLHEADAAAIGRAVEVIGLGADEDLDAAGGQGVEEWVDILDREAEVAVASAVEMVEEALGLRQADATGVRLHELEPGVAEAEIGEALAVEGLDAPGDLDLEAERVAVPGHHVVEGADIERDMVEAEGGQVPCLGGRASGAGQAGGDEAGGEAGGSEAEEGAAVHDRVLSVPVRHLAAGDGTEMAWIAGIR